jgi:hypothetical protein
MMDSEQEKQEMLVSEKKRQEIE